MFCLHSFRPQFTLFTGHGPVDHQQPSSSQQGVGITRWYLHEIQLFYNFQLWTMMRRLVSLLYSHKSQLSMHHKFLNNIFIECVIRHQEHGKVLMRVMEKIAHYHALFSLLIYSSIVSWHNIIQMNDCCLMASKLFFVSYLAIVILNQQKWIENNYDESSTLVQFLYLTFQWIRSG